MVTQSGSSVASPLICSGAGLESGSIADSDLRKSMAAGVAAGTYEIQLNQVARRMLGMPKS